MSAEDRSRYIVVTEGAKTVPVEEILTGRGFITGKSGSGKSNSGGVIAEKLLDNGFGLLIVDPEGEYYGLQDEYDLVHAGADEEFCDVEVGPEDGERLAEIALEDNTPVILDVSGYFAEEDANEVVEETVKHLYQKEKHVQKPFLLLVEEMHEFLPQTGSSSLSKLLTRVGKRGRKRGLGMLGMSQRPSSVDKDYITQCDWLVWHRLTWDNDVRQAEKILGPDRAEELAEFDAGEAYMMTDWDDTTEHVQFKRKETPDVGATPGLDGYESADHDGGSADYSSELGGGQSEDDAADADASLEQAELEATEMEPVETIDSADGTDDTVTEQDRNSSADQGTDGESASETEPETAVPEDGSDVDDLQQELERKQRQNEILADELEELKQILDDVQPRDDDPFAQPTTTEETDTDPPTQKPMPAPETASSDDRTTSPPDVPERPKDRDGVAGNLIEFVQMVLYVCKMGVFRAKRAVQAARNPSTNVEEKQ